MPSTPATVAIVGGGILGLATAYEITRRFPERSVVVLEKEPELALHQTGRNSGVLHSGIYYKPGSLKARNCRLGKQAMEAFCEEEGIPYDLCGKVIVAVDEDERPTLHRIYERGLANGVSCSLIDADRLREIEPHARGVEAIHVPEAGIVDYRAVCARLAERIEERGGIIRTGTRFLGLEEDGDHLLLETSRGPVAAGFLVTCAGLQSDRVLAATGGKPDFKIVPFRGEYYELKPEAHHLCNGLIYPVPDPSFPFLGVHFTRIIDGGVECGPNAVLAFAREGYTRGEIVWSDLWETLRYAGFRRLASRYWKTGLGEFKRSLSKRAFVRALQRLVPEIRSEHLLPHPAGVRAQALMPDGTLVDDFLIRSSGRVVNVCNAPSPAATASLNIARLIVEELAGRMN